MKILFVCRANQGRSQVAEGLFRKLCQGKHEVFSAGTRVVRADSNKEGQKISDPNIIAVLREEGIDASEYVRNQITPQMVEKADKIVVMAEPENWPDFLKESNKVVYWETPDFSQQSLEFVRKYASGLKQKIKDLLKILD